MTLLLNGDPQTAKLILRDLVNSTIGFEVLAGDLHKPSKSLHRMLKVLRKEAIPGYLMAYNEVLGGMRPLDLLTSGQADKVAADIASLEAGVLGLVAFDIEREMERAAEKRGITPKDLLPRDIVTIAVSLQKVLDLTDPAILLVLKFNVDDLTKDAYDDTCALARAVFRAGIEGIVVPSAIGKGKNLVIYLENLSSKSSVSEKRRRKMQL